MIVITKYKQTIGTKEYDKNVQIQVTNEVGRRLVMDGLAWNIDATETATAVPFRVEQQSATMKVPVKYAPKKKKINPKN
jgi:hypothetical protein